MMPIIVDYNQHEAAERLRDWVGDCIIVDNGSDTPFPGATVRLDTNQETIGGIRAGLERANRRGAKYYWLLSTSMLPLPCPDPAGELEKCFEEGIVGVSPQWTGNIKSPAHSPMMKTGQTQWLNPFSAWRADWLDAIGRFNPRLTTGWGVDFETGYIARQLGVKLIVTGRVQVEIHETRHGGRTDFARNEMNTILTEKYGRDWRKVLGVNV